MAKLAFRMSCFMLVCFLALTHRPEEPVPPDHRHKTSQLETDTTMPQHAYLIPRIFYRAVS